MQNTPNASFHMTSTEDLGLETYDHTKLSAINTCVTWGILRYQMHKRMPGDGRAIALEAGTAMHEVFSLIRLISLIAQCEKDGRDQSFLDALWHHHGRRLFGIDRLVEIDLAIRDAGDIVEVCKRGAISVLDTSGFFDDPRDKRRTLSNLEECAYAYVNRWRFDHPVWMRDPGLPTSDVGIEIPFDVVCEIARNKPRAPPEYPLKIRLTGRIDGIHYNTHGELAMHDNKTASRLGDAWAMSQQLSHQYTGYCVAASVFTDQPVRSVEVLGLAIPLPKTYDYGGYVREVMHREDHHFKRWLAWLVHTVDMCRAYAGNPFDAPKYTHSCNRYFRPCSFIPFCDADDKEQHIIVNEMVLDEWSPLAKPILDGVGSE